MIYVVTENKGVIAWLKKKGIDGKDVRFVPGWGVTDFGLLKPGDVIIAGNLPLLWVGEIIARGAIFGLLTLPTTTSYPSNQELTPEQLESFGAKVTQVIDIKIGGSLV